MRPLEFQLRVLEPHAAPELATSFRSLGTLDCNPRMGLFVSAGSGTETARSAFDDAATRAHGRELGDWTLEDVWVAGSRGLLIDLRRRVIWMGHSIGWPINQVRFDVERELGGRIVDEETALLDKRLFTKAKSKFLKRRPGSAEVPWQQDPFAHQPPRRRTRLSLLSAPGVGYYGHWLIDFVPRLASYEGDDRAGALYAPKLRPWARQLVSYYRVQLERPAIGWPGSLLHTELLELRTLLQVGKVLSRPHANAAWEDLASRVRAEPLVDDLRSYGPRLYVSRARWSGGRTLANNFAIEKALIERGFSVVHPETLSLRAQVEIFSRAERIVGEDGSGLHNTVFAPSGLHQTVLNVDRTNTFHASVANARGQRISYLASEPVDGGHAVPVERLLSHLDLHP